MAWVRIHDGAMGHRKVLKLTGWAFKLWVAGLAYCQQQLTDGEIPSEALGSFAVPRVKQRASDLVAVGLWTQSDHGYTVHDYLEWNDSRETIVHKRQGLRRRVAIHREEKKRVTSTRVTGSLPTSGVVYREAVSRKDEASDSSVSGRWLQWFRHEAYPQHRGAPYTPSRMQEEKDLDAARRLERSYSPRAIQAMTEAFLRAEGDDGFLRAGKTRTPVMLLSMASGIYETLVKAGWKDDETTQVVRG